MRIWRDVTEVPVDVGRTVVTIGNFDGVHRGHQRVVRRAREVAREVGAARVVLVTFDPHPFAVLRPEHAPLTLSTVPARLAVLAEAGVDDALVLRFSREIAGWSPEEFVDRVLVDALHAAAVVVGASFRFGHKAAGDVALLTREGDKKDFVVEGVDLDGGPQVWSSTYVRSCLVAGDVEGAAEALGRPFAVRGVVVEGDKRGRELGYPTANVPVVGVAAPGDGVYAGWLWRLDTDETYAAAISVGTNPTFEGERERRIEAYVLDRDDLDLYGVEVEVAFVARLRGMVRFDDLASLVSQMDEDVARAAELLS
ncbi:MAG: bifunctional riboflavin kinase/FAD synthetase [Nocardioides sp.]